MSLVATADFAYLQQLVMDRSAIVLADDKEYLLKARLQPVAREMGLASAEEVMEKVRLTRDRALEKRIVEAMTTNETLWFRDVNPFNALRRTVLPELIARRRSSRRLSVWSAACSSGQELYSVAMLLGDSFPEVLEWDLTLMGTDLSSEMVDRARAGSYSTLEMNRGLPAALLVRHFDRDGNQFRIHDDIRKLARFQTMNLAEPWPALPLFDLILLRNVLIYFDVPTRKRVLTAAGRALGEGGYLFIGSSETMMGVTDAFEGRTADGATFYRIKKGTT